MKKNLTHTLLLLVMAVYCSTSLAQNEDFEAAPTGTITSVTAVSGWSFYTTVHTFSTNSCALPQASGTPSASAVFSTTTGYTDPSIGSGYPIFSVFGAVPGSAAAVAANPQLNFAPAGTSFLRLNNSDVSVTRIEMARKVVSVTSANSLFDVAYIHIQQGAHACCDAPAFTVKINNGNCSMLATVCSTANSVTWYNPINNQPITTPGYSGLAYTKWNVKTIDLGMYSAQTVTIDIIASHCTAGSHASVAYVDTRFRPASVAVNGITTTLTANAVNTLVSCQANMTLSVPSNNTNYLWSGPGGFTSTLSTISTALPGNYVLTTNNGNACSATTNSFYLSFPATTLQVSASTSSICPANTATLSAVGASSQTWMPGSQTTSAVAVSPVATTMYTVTGTNASGCAVQNTIVLTVAVVPVLQPVCSTPTVCAGSAATINLVSGNSPTWSPGTLTGTSIVVSPTLATVYTVTAIGPSACNAQGTIAIGVYTSASIPLLPSSTTPSICVGATAAIVVNANGTATWQPGALTGNTISVSPAGTTVYSVVATNTDGCLVYGTYMLDVLPVACASITTSSATILAGNPATLTAFGLNTFTWQTGSNAQSIVVTPSVTTDYSVHGHTAAGAYGVASITQFVVGAVGIAQTINLSSFRMYPNPATVSIQILTAGEQAMFYLFDLSGRKVLEKNLSGLEQIKIDVSGIEPGLYQIVLKTSGSEVYTEKLQISE